jgi:hypothetical protein
VRDRREGISVCRSPEDPTLARAHINSLTEKSIRIALRSLPLNLSASISGFTGSIWAPKHHLPSIRALTRYRKSGISSSRIHLRLANIAQTAWTGIPIYRSISRKRISPWRLSRFGTIARYISVTERPWRAISRQSKDSSTSPSNACNTAQ